MVGKCKGRTVLKPESAWVYNRVEPIISEDTWNRCAALLDESAEKWKRKHLLPLQADRAEQLVGRMIEPFEDARVIRHARRIAVREGDAMRVGGAVDFHCP